jgi:hypothetical protein
VAKIKNKHWDKRGGGGTGGSGKTPIVGAVSRKGNVIARVSADLKASTLQAFVPKPSRIRSARFVPINGPAIDNSAKNSRMASSTIRQVST